MALPKSMRYLAAATFCILGFIFVQLLSSPNAKLQLPSNLVPPSTLKKGEWKDPQLSREFTSSPLYFTYRKKRIYAKPGRTASCILDG